MGRVSQRGDDLKLSLELVNTETQDVIWSEQYNRKQSDLVSLQSEIAKTVSDKLRLKLTTTEQERVSKTYTTSSEAQQLYLKGRFHWNKRTTEDFQKAREYFQQAIANDPSYALAHTGLADTLALMPFTAISDQMNICRWQSSRHKKPSNLIQSGGSTCFARSDFGQL